MIEVDAPAAPPPRRVIVERMTNLPPRPQDIIVEKWLPYRPQKRRVVFQRAASMQQLVPRNLIIEWEAPDVEVVKQCRDLGVVDADPEEYCRRFGKELKKTHELPTCGQQQPQPQNVPTTITSAYARLCQPQCNNCSSHYPGDQRIFHQQHPSNNCSVHYGNQYRAMERSHLAGSMPSLEGDVDALRLVDLNRHGLQSYSNYVGQSQTTTHISL